MNTNINYSPWDQLPAPEPRSMDYPPNHFYENTAKHLIKDTVRIMNNGLHIDLNKVIELEATLNNQLANVEQNLHANPYIKEYLAQRYTKLLEEYLEDRKDKLRTTDYYLKDFKPSDMVHRSYFMYIYSKKMKLAQPTELLPTGVPKWKATTVKKFADDNPLLKKLLNKQIPPDNSIAKEAMQLLAEHKQAIYNKSFEDQIKNPSVDFPAFNSNSSTQKQELFAMLGIESEKTSKDTGKPSFDRDELERIGKETIDPLVKDLVHQLIDNSYASIVRNNFIKAFYTYTVEDRLYGNYKLLGAKSARYTSNKPNMLNMPSTGSVFAKPIKECFTAPEGFLIAGIDYSALEDRVVANLSRDNNKLGLFLEGLDGHSLSATYYYPERVAAIIGEFTDNKEASRQLKAIVDDEDHPKHKLAKEVRQDAKPISFGLAYGAFPKKVAATVKISIEEATAIFNAYHKELYPGITEFREEYVLPTADAKGRIHLGLGFYIQSDNPERDIRTLNNACSQFWSILTALTINKIHQLIDEEGLQEDIKVTSTIYDSIYFEVRKDPKLIKWLNDKLIPIMEQDFMENQIVKNSANLEIGTSWAKLKELPHDISVEEIKQIIKELYE